MISLGLDSGSSMTKAVLLEDMKIIDTKMIPTSISPRKSLEALYREIKKQHKEIDVIVTTGYGRNLLDQADFKITEITCHAAGAFFMNPDCDTIIDIGGQDSKVITIDNIGCVTDFLMNDKCAAGTDLLEGSPTSLRIRRERESPLLPRIRRLRRHTPIP